MVRNVLNVKERTILPHQKFCRGKPKEQDANECFHIGKETIHKVHVSLRLNGNPIIFIFYSGATLNVIRATFVKDNKMEQLLKKGKKLDFSVYVGKKKG